MDILLKTIKSITGTTITYTDVYESNKLHPL